MPDDQAEVKAAYWNTLDTTTLGEEIEPGHDLVTWVQRASVARHRLSPRVYLTEVLSAEVDERQAWRKRRRV